MTLTTKTKTVLGWTLTSILVPLFVLAGIPKIIGMAGVLDMFEHWGYPGRFAHVVGTIEVVGAILLAIPKTMRFGIYLLVMVMVGAFFTHIFAAEWPRLLINTSLALALWGVLVTRTAIQVDPKS